MKSKIFFSLLTVTALTVSLFAGTITAFSSEKGDIKLTIVHTNDVHARVNIEPYASQLVKDRKASGENVLLLSAGDVLHGQPIATLSRGKNIVDIMNATGYDAITPGNHDFNYGAGRLKALAPRMKFPILAANVKNNITGQNTFTPYIVKEIDGVKVGIFGLATPETKTKTNPSNVDTLEFENPVRAASLAVDALKSEGCGIIICIAHLGDGKDTWYYERSTPVADISGIDVIIDGHSHTVLKKGKLIGNTLVAQTGGYSENIGVVELDISNGKVKSKKASLIPTPRSDDANPVLAADPTVSALIEKINAETSKITSEIVGHTAVTLNGERSDVRTSQTNLGDLITDSMLAESGAQIAIHNGGSIRATIPAGDVTKGDILTVLPFSNYIVVKQVTGADIIAILEKSVEAYPSESGGFLHVGGMRYSFDPDAKAGSRIVSVTLDSGTPLIENESYSLAANDFLVDGGDGYDILKSSTSQIIYSALDEALIKYMQTNPVIRQSPDGRSAIVKKANKAA